MMTMRMMLKCSSNFSPDPIVGKKINDANIFLSQPVLESIACAQILCTKYQSRKRKENYKKISFRKSRGDSHLTI